MKSYIVDSFTKEPFKGNPAGVCFPEKELSNETMLKIAQEFNLSETAFVRATAKAGFYDIRYFSPRMEIPLCGHATLASAKIIFRNNDIKEIHFITGDGLDLLIKRHEDEIIMEFPVYHTVPAMAPPAMLQALGLAKVVNTTYCDERKVLLLEIENAELLAGLQPDFDALVRSHDGIRGVTVTSPSDSRVYDYHYRYFWPWSGSNEDPVTGGIQTFLAKYWAEKLGKRKMKAFQSSARTGYMSLEVQAHKVLITGNAVIVLEGTLVS
jgi:PhzF family phenazine biosynthesis protein